MKVSTILSSIAIGLVAVVASPLAEPEADFLTGRSLHGYCQAANNADKGTCEKTSFCKAAETKGFISDGDCPYDPDDVKCCEAPLCMSGKGRCHTVSYCNKYGISHHAGYCPGPTDYQCCIF